MSRGDRHPRPSGAAGRGDTQRPARAAAAVTRRAVLRVLSGAALFPAVSRAEPERPVGFGLRGYGEGRYGGPER